MYVNGFCNQIHKRVEPVNGGCEQYEALVPQILMLIVNKLMIKDKAKLICGKMYVGEKYPGVDKACQHRRTGTFTLVEVDFTGNAGFFSDILKQPQDFGIR